jgi:putative copper export protein
VDGTQGGGGAIWEAPLRWLNYLGVALVLGTALFRLFMWRRAQELPALGILALGGALVLLGANLVLIVVQAAYAADVGLTQAMGQPLVDVLGTRSGWDWAVRMLVIALLVMLAWSLPARSRGVRWWAVALLAAMVMLSISLVSHAATAWGPPLSIALDWIHLLAAGAWLGALPALALALRELRRRPDAATSAAELISRFSSVAVLSVGVLVLTGLYNASLHLGGLGSLFSSDYGRVLAVKLGLFGVLLAFGALNKFILLPRLQAHTSEVGTSPSPSAAVGPFLRTIPAEVTVGAGLLLVVGVLTSIAPV